MVSNEELEKLFYEGIKKAGYSKEKAEQKIKDKINQMQGLINRRHALYLVANELGIFLPTELTMDY